MKSLLVVNRRLTTDFKRNDQDLWRTTIWLRPNFCG